MVTGGTRKTDYIRNRHDFKMAHRLGVKAVGSRHGLKVCFKRAARHNTNQQIRMGNFDVMVASPYLI